MPRYRVHVHKQVLCVVGAEKYDLCVIHIHNISLRVGCPECSTKCNVDLKKKLLILFPTMAEKQIDRVLASDGGMSTASPFCTSTFAVYTMHEDIHYGYNTVMPHFSLVLSYTHTDETVGKKYAALLIQHIWRSRAARTRKVMEMFQGSQGTIRLRVREGWVVSKF